MKKVRNVGNRLQSLNIMQIFLWLGKILGILLVAFSVMVGGSFPFTFIGILIGSFLILVLSFWEQKYREEKCDLEFEIKKDLRNKIAILKNKRKKIQGEIIHERKS